MRIPKVYVCNFVRQYPLDDSVWLRQQSIGYNDRMAIAWGAECKRCDAFDRKSTDLDSPDVVACTKPIYEALMWMFSQWVPSVATHGLYAMSQGKEEGKHRNQADGT
ncbi:hypothetical protein ACT3UJ_06670 [Halomonas sp. 86]|uniref:hypothetical protein n=1 Tax=Halomonas sp. 111 TaxID=3457735 RepID=UPI004034700F